MHEHCFQLFHVVARYTLLPTKPMELSPVIEQLRSGKLDGLNVTRPFKTDVVSYLDDISAAVRHTGAVNCISIDHGKLHGHNTDVNGILYSLDQAGISLAGKRCIIIGHGGGARAALAVLQPANVAAITIAGRRQEALTELADEFSGANAPGPIDTLALTALESLEAYDLVINATPVGMAPDNDQSILPPELFHPGMAVLDMVYNPARTKLLNDAANAGCTIADGVDMLIGQGLASQAIWSTAPTDRRADALLNQAELNELKTIVVNAIDTINTATEGQEEV
jgi:shikimate dehydrogenase